MMPEKITVSNGREVYRIDPADLDDATQDGFYRPIEHGQTLVGKDNLIFASAQRYFSFMLSVCRYVRLSIVLYPT